MAEGGYDLENPEFDRDIMMMPHMTLTTNYQWFQMNLLKESLYIKANHLKTLEEN